MSNELKKVSPKVIPPSRLTGFLTVDPGTTITPFPGGPLILVPVGDYVVSDGVYSNIVTPLNFDKAYTMEDIVYNKYVFELGADEMLTWTDGSVSLQAPINVSHFTYSQIADKINKQVDLEVFEGTDNGLKYCGMAVSTLEDMTFAIQGSIAPTS